MSRTRLPPRVERSAVEAAEPLAQILGTFRELDDLQAVGREEAGVARPEEGEAELKAAADLPAPAQIADRVRWRELNRVRVPEIRLSRMAGSV